MEIGKDFGDQLDASGSAVPAPTQETGDETMPLEIVSVEIKHNSIGTPEIYVVVKNTGHNSIDAFNFEVRGYDSYGDIIDYIGADTFTCTYDGDVKAIKPDGESQRNRYWSLYQLDSASKFEVALTKCHDSSDTTYELKESAKVWYTVTLNK